MTKREFIRRLTLAIMATDVTMAAHVQELLPWFATGSRPGGSCETAQLIKRCCLEDAAQFGKLLIDVNYDAVKAYDRHMIEFSMAVLEAIGLPA